jgi:predicted membrane channel-forming protein YqfA (hemolysin III family)
LENNAMRRHPHVLNAATNLLGICFIIIGGLKLTNQNARTYSDEIAWAAAFFLVVSIAMSYFGVREGIERAWRVRIADWSFLFGIAALIVSMVIAAYQL